MTAVPATLTTVTGAGRAAHPDRAAVVLLGRLEARRNLRSPLLVLAVAFTAFTARNMVGVGWSGASYQMLPLYFLPLAILAFFQGLRSAGRDGQADRPPLAEEAPLSEGERALGRLLGLSVYVAIAVAGTLVVEVVSRIEGGYWMGSGPTTTYSAQHHPVELLQPAAMVAATAALGVAAGRRFRRRVGIGVAAGVIAFLQWGVYWAWQWVPMLTVTLAQVQPLGRYAGPAGSTYGDFPADWWVVAPDQYTDVWMRQVISPALAAGHVVYLLGVTAVAVASALRPRGDGPGAQRGGRPPLSRRLRVVGWASVAAGILVQLAALGWIVTPGGTGLGQVP